MDLKEQQALLARIKAQNLKYGIVIFPDEQATVDLATLPPDTTEYTFANETVLQNGCLLIGSFFMTPEKKIVKFDASIIEPNQRRHDFGWIHPALGARENQYVSITEPDKSRRDLGDRGLPAGVIVETDPWLTPYAVHVPFLQKAPAEKIDCSFPAPGSDPQLGINCNNGELPVGPAFDWSSKIRCPFCSGLGFIWLNRIAFHVGANIVSFRVRNQFGMPVRVYSCFVESQPNGGLWNQTLGHVEDWKIGDLSLAED